MSTHDSIPVEDGQARRSFGDTTVAAIFGAATAAALFFYYYLAGQVPTWDGVHLFSPYFSLLADFARAGRLLLWNPYVNCGSPDMAYVEMGSFSPVTLLLALVTGGGHTGFLIYWTLIWGLFGFGACRLAFHLGAPRPWGMAIAAGLMFSGFFLGHASHTSWLYAFAFLPLMVWRLDAGLQSGRSWPVVEAGAFYGLSALAGHPALVILNDMYLGCWALGRIIFTDGPDPAIDKTFTRRAAASLIALALLLAVGLIVMSPAYLAFFYEAAGFSERTGYLARDLAIDDQALPPLALATLSSPYLAALKVFNPNYLKEAYPPLVDVYAGAALLATALTGLILGRRDRFRWWLAAVGIFFLLASLGSSTPIRGWLYDLFPPTRFFRHSGVMRGYFLFTLGVIAMRGGRDFIGSSGSRAWKFLFGIAAVLAPVAATALAVSVHPLENHGPHLTAAWIHLAVAWAGLGLISFLAWRDEQRRNLFIGLLVPLALIDGAFGVYLSRPIMVEGRLKYEWMELERNRETNPPGLLRLLLPEDSLLTDFNFFDKTPWAEGYNQLSHRYHSRTSLTPLGTSWSNEPVLFSAVIGRQSRIWFSPQADFVSPSDAAFAAFIQRSRQLGAIPLVLHHPDNLLRLPSRGEPGPNDDADVRAIAGLPASIPVDVELIEYTPTRLAFKVTCPQDGWLLVTDRWARSWRARIDGRETEVLGGNFLFRALAVGRGLHTVEFEFRPFLFPLPLVAGWGTLLLIGAVSLRFARLRAGRYPD